MQKEIGKGLVEVTGKVSNIQNSVHTAGSVKTGPVTGNVSGSMSSHDQFTFRVDNTPVTFVHEGGMDVAEGDEVVVVGKMKKGQLEAYAVKNINTQARYDQYQTAHLVMLIFAQLLAIGLIVVVIGVIATPYIAYILLGTLKRKYAAEHVEAYSG